MAQKRTRPTNYPDECSGSSSKKKQKNGGSETGLMPDKFINFCELCTKIGEESGYNAKTTLIKEFIASNSSQGKYVGDLYLLVKFLLPHVQKRIYNLKDKQLVKLFSQVFKCDPSTMSSHLEKSGNVSETVTKFFKGNSTVAPKNSSHLSLLEVDHLLDDLSAVTKEEDQLEALTKIVKRCTTLELMFIVRLIKHDLRMNAGTKHILDALDVNAYAAFQASSNLKDVVGKVVKNMGTDGGAPGLKKKLSIKTAVMTPVKPMLAEACKSVDMAFKKCPSGIYAEIKYDGERVQVHKEGSEFKYYSRSLKPVQPHKVSEFKDLLPQACPLGDSLILDGEVLLVDNKTGKPLPFGTLGIHKKSAFKDATVCYFIFDILQLNEDNLMKKPLVQRRQILQSHISEVKHRIQLSEMNEIKDSKDLHSMLQRVFAENLEGLVLKDKEGVYEPGKRHWLKMKKDYLEEGAMADTADLVVLGAYYGTGNKGGLMSVFLMGCYDPDAKLWMTVTKCGNGHDDAALKRLQKELKMDKVNKMQPTTPSWLHINKTLMPDLFVKDPKEAPVWEITGAEFSKSSTHTAGGISIRFPRVTRIRGDKDWRTATDLPALKRLYEASKEKSDVDHPAGVYPAVDSPSPLPDKAQPGTSKPGNSNPPQVKATPGSKPVCKYGANCYQKNAEHKEKFSHPEPMAEGLQSVFKGLHFCFGDDLDQKDVKKLKRYIIAYDGDVVDKYHVGCDTYLVTDKQESQVNSSKTVSTKWVWQSIQRGEPETKNPSS